MTTTLPGQFRLSQIQVYNWGTFDNLHCVEVPREGFLITGPSGSGKSTLIDAISTILVPPGKIRFNAAADNQAHSGRNLVTYCRGAWRREHSIEADELTQSYLRTGATWTGVALRYSDGAGETITACRLMFLPANAYSRQEITDLYILLPRDADLTEFEDLAQKNLPVTEAKKTYSDALHVSRNHPKFSLALRRAVGIADAGALDLLNRTQSAKTLGDLNHLMRTFMLPEPETFEIAEQAAENFTDLRTAYESVVKTRKQIEQLVPVRVAAEKRAEVENKLTAVKEDRGGVETFVDEWRQHFAEQERDQRISEIKAVSATIEEATGERDRHRAQADQLRTLIHGAQDSALVSAQARRDRLQDRLERVSKEEEAFNSRLKSIGATKPGSAEEFTNLVLQLSEEKKRLSAAYETEEEKLAQAHVRVHELAENKKKRIAELEALRKYESAMDNRLLRARALIAERSGVRESDLPFIADLVSMKPGEGHWQGTAERVMGGFARRILVPDEHYEQVSSAIDDTYLGAKVSYTRFTRDLEEQRPSRFVPNSLGLKINVKPGRYHDWIQTQLSTKFDYLCCDSVEEFRAARRAVTAKGQVKHNRNDHIKDDRRRVDDRSNWVLWGNLADKIDALQASVRSTMAKLEHAERQRKAIAAGQEKRRAQKATIERLLETERFQDIDVSSATQEFAEAQRDVDELTDGNAELAQLKAKLKGVEAALDKVEEQIMALRNQLSGFEFHLEQAEETLERVRNRRGGKTVSEDVAARLTERCMAIDRTIRSDNIDALSNQLIRGIEDQLAELNARFTKHGGDLVNAMNLYLVRWPDRAGDLKADMEWEQDFLRELGRLEADDLPRFEQRFRDMLQDETHKHLGRLRRLIRDAAAKTRSSIQMINDSLAEVEFYPGAYLTIEVREAQPAIARDFVELLDSALAGIINEADQEESEQRFHKLQAVIDAVTVSDATSTRDRQLRLDTRQHVKFLGVEYSKDGARGAVYDSSEGLSGGQAQKLSSFCLAAALRYRLTGMGLPAAQEKKSIVRVGEDIYPRFGTIVLDEAFDRADTEFTRAAMEAFRRFGFHMILATPEKLLQTVQDYIGGVLMVECPDRKRSRTSSLTIEEVQDEDP